MALVWQIADDSSNLPNFPPANIPAIWYGSTYLVYFLVCYAAVLLNLTYCATHSILLMNMICIYIMHICINTFHTLPVVLTLYLMQNYNAQNYARIMGSYQIIFI